MRNRQISSLYPTQLTGISAEILARFSGLIIPFLLISLRLTSYLLHLLRNANSRGFHRFLPVAVRVAYLLRRVLRRGDFGVGDTAVQSASGGLLVMPAHLPVAFCSYLLRCLLRQKTADAPDNPTNSLHERQTVRLAGLRLRSATRQTTRQAPDSREQLIWPR